MTPSEKVMTKNSGTAVQNESLRPTSTAVSDHAAKLRSSSLLRYRHLRLNTSTTWLPAIVDSERSATPQTC